MIPYVVKEHRFGSGQTIEAAINLYNMHSLSNETCELLMTIYNELNGKRPPRLGELVKIPVISIEVI